MSIACITGDVHHFLGNNAIERDEYKFAAEYARIVSDHGLRATLFVTGKCISEHEHFWKKLSNNKQIELGAHTYFAFKDPLYPLLSKFQHGLDKIDELKNAISTDLAWRLYYSLDVKKTVNAFRLIGIRPAAWRTHNYAGKPALYDTLSKFGFKVVSDTIYPKKKRLSAFRIGKLIMIPITYVKDDDVKFFYLNGLIKHMKREGKRIQKSVFELMKKKKDIVIQLHPLQAKVLDDFKTFIVILDELEKRGYITLTISQLAERLIESCREKMEAYKP